jgi:hypothetical protein
MRRNAEAVASYWPPAYAELVKLNALFEASARKPENAAALKKAFVAANKAVHFSVWVGKCLLPEKKAALLEVTREIYRMSKAEDSAMHDVLRRFKVVMQDALDSAAPAQFNYRGFKVLNPEHLGEALCRKTLVGVDFLQKLFAQRGVVNVIEQSVSGIRLELGSGSTASFHAGTRELTLSVGPETGKPGRFTDSFLDETFVHEFGHLIHRTYITGEAAAYWDAPWKGLSSVDPLRKERLDALEVVTEYGRTDKYEDFAETFMLYMISPEKLTPTAKFRMQRTLSLTGLYGKPVMRKASNGSSV